MGSLFPPHIDGKSPTWRKVFFLIDRWFELHPTLLKIIYDLKLILLAGMYSDLINKQLSCDALQY
jgi:hypothetical protein